MPALRENHYDEASRRSSFNGKDLTFVEIIFDSDVAGTALDDEGGPGTPDVFNSPFGRVSEYIRAFGTILAQSYELAADSSVGDAALVTDIVATEDIDVFTFLLEGADLFGDGEAAQITTVKAGVIVQLGAIGGLNAITNVDTGAVGVRVSTLRFNGDNSDVLLVGWPNGRDG